MERCVGTTLFVIKMYNQSLKSRQFSADLRNCKKLGFWQNNASWHCEKMKRNTFLFVLLDIVISFNLPYQQAELL